MSANTEQRVIVTVIGKDKVGIIAGVANVLTDAHANILDISQTRLQEFLVMIMIADISQAKVEFTQLLEELDRAGERIGVKITAQREDVFNFMHRI